MPIKCTHCSKSYAIAEVVATNSVSLGIPTRVLSNQRASWPCWDCLGLSMLLYVRRSSLFGTTQCTLGFGLEKNHLPWCSGSESAGQVSLPGKWVFQASESARQVSLPSRWICRASEFARGMPRGKLYTARQRAFYVRQDISRRGHHCRKPDTEGLQLSISAPSSVPPGIRTHVSFACSFLVLEVGLFSSWFSAWVTAPLMVL
jgi:hypothetical protein